ncbi:RNA-guided endonuclease InsQ/TnpB family protein [Glutamicibacter endophyticus]|uniref:RNA-guided endonuclease InsQ/TnpB family protein n=1 Tax=Glutamicibacter endophyticus TaxID=1522174 RepID=UPI003AF08C8D
MHRAHKIALDPTNVQATGLTRAAGTARFAYNWALAHWNQQYAARLADPSLPAPSQYALRRELNRIKRTEFPWMLESTKCAPQEAIIALGVGFKNFFAGRAKHPTFKKKGVSAESFRLSSGQFRIEGKRLRVPNIGWVRMREAVRFENAKLISVTISKRAGHWYASISCDVTDPLVPTVPVSTVGVDLGVREYVVSDGTRHQVPRALRNAQRSLKRAQQSLARTAKGSKNRAKARRKVATIHQRVANARHDWIHKLTTGLADAHDRIVIEDLNVSGMMKNHRLALSIADASFGEFRRQLDYKTRDRNTTLIVADRWFPSSKTCSACGAKTTRTMALHVRAWACEACGATHDRDLNAAINLAVYAGSSSVSACGELFASAGTESDGLVPTNGLDDAGTRQHQVT